MNRPADDSPIMEIVDRYGRVWDRVNGGIIVSVTDGEQMALPSGWKHGSITYFSYDVLAAECGPLTLRLSDREAL